MSATTVLLITAGLVLAVHVFGDWARRTGRAMPSSASRSRLRRHNAPVLARRDRLQPVNSHVPFRNNTPTPRSSNVPE